MYSWIIRISTAAVGTVLAIMVRVLEWYPVFYIFPLTLILFALWIAKMQIAVGSDR